MVVQHLAVTSELRFWVQITGGHRGFSLWSSTCGHPGSLWVPSVQINAFGGKGELAPRN